MEDVILENLNPQVLTVSELTNGLKRVLEGTFADIWIKGEVTNYKHHSSGHRYFSMKDDKAVIQATLFKQYASLVKFEIEDGLEVKVHGSISLYPPRGQYQINVDFIEPVGKGALQLAFEQLCAKLRAEGIFDKVKRPIPKHPQNIGVITSETGAALQDILRVTKERNASLNIYIFPASVQGESAAKEIAEAIKKANEIGNTDVLIVGRGGGSIEDLWAFNEPVVAYAIYNSKIPVISAVGHEINFSISDMVADMYASTPSAAATFVCKSLEEFNETILSYKNVIFTRTKSLVELYKARISKYNKEAIAKTFQNYISILKNKVEDYKWQLNNNVDKLIYNKKTLLSSIKQKIEALNPLSILDRGYSVVSKEGVIINSVSSLNKGDVVVIRLKDGEIQAQIL